MKVYIASASSEIGLVETWTQNLRAVGVHVVSTWPDVIKAVGAANPPEASHADRKGWAVKDLDEVCFGDVLWFRLPSEQSKTVGAWVELGCAWKAHKLIVISGKHSSIFTGLADHVFTTDQEAFDFLVYLHRKTP